MHVVGIGDTLGARKTCNKAANTQMEPTRQTVMHDDVAAARRNKIGPQSVPRGCPTTLFLSRWQETLHYARSELAIKTSAGSEQITTTILLQ